MRRGRGGDHAGDGEGHRAQESREAPQGGGVGFSHMGSVRGDEAALPLWVGNADGGCLTSYDKVTDCCKSAKLRESSSSRGWPVARSTEAGGPAVPVVVPAGTASGPGDRAARP